MGGVRGCQGHCSHVPQGDEEVPAGFFVVGMGLFLSVRCLGITSKHGPLVTDYTFYSYEPKQPFLFRRCQRQFGAMTGRGQIYRNFGQNLMGCRIFKVYAMHAR